MSRAHGRIDRAISTGRRRRRASRLVGSKVTVQELVWRAGGRAGVHACMQTDEPNAVRQVSGRLSRERGDLPFVSPKPKPNRGAARGSPSRPSTPSVRSQKERDLRQRPSPILAARSVRE